MSIIIYEANNGEEFINVIHFSSHFNFPEKKDEKEDNFKKEAKKRRFWKKRGKRGKRGGVGCQIEHDK